MDVAVSVISWLFVLAAIGGLLIFFLRRLVFSQKFCVGCGRLTRHKIDYGVSPLLSYLMAFMTLGWRTMVQTYYKYKCEICGRVYEPEPATNQKEASSTGASFTRSVFGDWKGLESGSQDWRQLKFHQKLLLVAMIILGLALTVIYVTTKKG